MRLPARVRTTLHTGPDAAATRSPAEARASIGFSTDDIEADSSLSILVNTQADARPSRVHPVHLQRLRLLAMRTAALAAISRRGSHRLDDNADKH